MKTLKYIFLSLTAMILCSCIYEYPTYIPAGTKLELAFRLDSAALSSYPEISDLSSEEYDLRYVIKAYRSTNSGEYNSSCRVRIHQGRYNKSGQHLPRGTG